jgi:translation initiation factor 4E
MKKINSVEYFRKGIEPKWEDEQNQKGGRFIFQVPRAQPNKHEIYERLTFFFIGEDFEHSEKVNGFRFISSKNPKSVSFRIEIWCNFDESDTDSILHYQNVLSALFKELAFEIKSISFKQMKDEGKKEPRQEESKGDHKGEHKGEAKAEPKTESK